MKTKIDPHTGEIFEPKRSDQKFATRKNQIDYNNARAKKARHETKHIDQILKKNRTIIMSFLNGKESVKVSIEFLLFQGFNLGVFNRLLNKEQKQVYGVYEYYVLPVDENNYELGKLDNDGTSN